MPNIPGKPLLGFGDFFVGVKKTTGSTKQAAKTRTKPSSAKSTHRRVSVSKGSYTKGNVAKKALGGALKAGNKAKTVATKAAQRIAKYKADVKAGKHSPLFPLKVTRVQGDGCVVVGVVDPKAKKPAAKKPAAKPLTPQQKAVIDRHNKAIAKHFKANRKAAKAVKRAVKAAKKANTLVKKNAKFFGKAFAGKATKTRIRGELLGVLEPVVLSSLSDEGMDFIGSLVEDAGVDNAVDFLGAFVGQDDEGGGAVDYDAGDEGGDEDEKPEIVKAPNGKVLYDPKKDPDIVPIPKRGEPLSALNAQKAWDKVPEGAIIVPASPASNDVGSWSLMYDKPYIQDQQGRGFIWTSEGSEPLAWYLIGFDFEWNNPLADGRELGNYPLSIKVREKAGKLFPLRRVPNQFFGPIEGFDLLKAMDITRAFSQSSSLGESATNQWVNQQSQGGSVGAGPLVGNPKSQKFAGAMYAAADNKWFWLPENAPTWATQDIDRKIAETNAATVAANMAAARALAAEMEAEIAAKLEEEERKKAEEIAAQKKAEEERARAAEERQLRDEERAKVRQDEREKQQIEERRENRQRMAEERKQERAMSFEREKFQIEAAKRESETEAAAGRALIEQAQVWNEYAKKNPEAAMAAMKQQPQQSDSSAESDSMSTEDTDSDDTFAEQADEQTSDTTDDADDSVGYFFGD